MLAGQSWRDLERQVLDGTVRLERLLGASHAACFAGSWDGEPPAGRPVDIAVYVYRWSDDPVLERLREASFFEHPNLLRCFRVGTARFGRHDLAYAITELPQRTLREALKRSPFRPDDAQALGLQLAEGLAFLHQRNLVCCNLDLDTVALVDGQWKIADFSELRETGIGYSAETRRRVGMSPGTPPEAYEGLVLPAWDTWSLAVLLSTVLSPKPEGELAVPAGSRKGRRQLPEPFQSVIMQCLQSNPAERCNIEQVRQMLSVPPEPGTPKVLTLPTPPVEDIREVPPPDPAPGGGRRWLVAGIVGFVLLGLVAAVAFQIYADRRVRAELSPETAPLVVTPDVAPARAPEKTSLVEAPRKPPVEAVVEPEVEADRLAARSSPANDVAAIRNLLANWAAAGRRRNVGAQVNCYAPELERYYGTRNVSREVVRRDRQQALQQMGSVREYAIANIDINLTGTDAATATFDKFWEFVGRAVYSGHVKEQMGFRKQGGVWKIVSEHDLQIYRTRSS